MSPTLKNTLPALLPPLVLGLFSGRLLSEQWAIRFGPSWLAIILLTAVSCALSYSALRRRPPRQTWPLLLLFGYVVYPQPQPLVAGWLVLLATAVYGQLILKQRITKEKAWRVGLWATILLFTLLYIATLAPGLLPADNGEFQLVGATLGVAHPPGFPLYILLSKLMTWLPISATAAYKINLLSVFTSVGTLAFIYLAVFRLTKRPFAAMTAVFSLGTATTFWAQATTANIRSLTALFTAIAIYALICHWQEKAHGDRYLVLFAAALSFGFTHHLSLAFMGLIFGLSLILIDPPFFKTPSRWKRPLLAALLGLLPLLYLPLRAGAAVPGAVDSLNTLRGFLNHFFALGFQGDFFYFVQPAVLWQRLQVMGNVLTFQFSPWLLTGAFLGWGWLMRRNWRFGILLGGSFVLHTLITATYRAPQTVEYMLPAYLPVAICVGLCCGFLQNAAQAQPSGRRWVMVSATAVLLTVAIAQGWQRWPSFAALHHTEDTRDYTQNILNNAPSNSLILANWHWATPLWYLQTVEGQRPDVTIHYVVPSEGPYSQTWAAEIEAGLANGRSVIATYIDADAYANLPPAEPLGEAILFNPTPRTELPAAFTPLDLQLTDQLTVHGYALSHPSIEIGLESQLTIAWQADEPTALFAHLLDENDSIVAQADVTATPRADGLTLTQFRLTPRRGPGEYRLRLGSGADFAIIGTLPVRFASLPPATQNRVYRPVIDGSSTHILVGYDWDNSLPAQTRLYLHWQTSEGYFSTTHDNVSDPATPSLLTAWGVPQSRWQPPPAQPNDHYIPLGQGIVWLGRSLTDLETAVSPNTQYALNMQFLNGRPLLRDYVVSTRLVGYEADGFSWAWCDLVDGIPAMGSIPTLKWIDGSQVQSPRRLIFPPRTDPATFTDFCQSSKPAPDMPILYVDNNATQGQTVGGILRLYDAFTNRPLPILDERVTAVYSWIPLGETIIEE